MGLELFALWNYLVKISDRSPLQNSSMQEVTGVIPIMGKPSFSWGGSTEPMPGTYVLSINHKIGARGALGWLGGSA